MDEQPHRLVPILLISVAIQLGSIGTVRAIEPATLFSTKCSSCHTFGKGDKVGPDLKGATDRHPRPWLVAWIRSSETQIKRSDPAALTLFRKYKEQRMPDHDLSDAEIGALIDYLAAGGPANDEGHRLRPASEATLDDVRLGRRLFVGEVKLASGSMACAFCHAVSTESLRGGTLAPDLSDVYTRYRDWALDQRLKRLCIRSTAGSTASRVAEAESLALRAFFRAASAQSAQVSGR